MAIVSKALDSTGLAADTDRDPLPADPRVLLASYQLRDLLLRLCWSRYDLAAPVLARMISFYDTTAAQAGAAAEAHGRRRPGRAQRRDDRRRRRLQEPRGPRPHPAAGRTAAPVPAGHHRSARADSCRSARCRTNSPGSSSSSSTTPTTTSRSSPDPPSVHLPARHDDLARRLLSAACQASTFTLAALPGHHRRRPLPRRHPRQRAGDSRTVLPAARDRRPATSAAAGRTTQTSSAGSWSESTQQATQEPQLASRILDLIDAMVLARTYGLEEQLAKLDR